MVLVKVKLENNKCVYYGKDKVPYNSEKELIESGQAYLKYVPARRLANKFENSEVIIKI